MVLISARAKRELKRMGCDSPNFLRVARKHDQKAKCGFFIDSTLNAADEIIHDGDIRIVTDSSSKPFLKNLAIDFGANGLTVK